MALLVKENPTITEDCADRLLADELLDSFAIIHLVGALETAFGIELSAADLQKENFESLDALAAMVGLLQGN
jgi:Phosphopantetheine attachment site.